jgi:hypothetical protein
MFAVPCFRCGLESTHNQTTIERRSLVGNMPKDFEDTVLVIAPGYGSNYDMDLFRFGRKEPTFPLWALEAKGDENVCDNCINDLLSKGEIRHFRPGSGFMDELHAGPAFCDSCDVALPNDGPSRVGEVFVVALLEHISNVPVVLEPLPNPQTWDDRSIQYKLRDPANQPHWLKPSNVVCRKCFNSDRLMFVECTFEKDF